MKIIHYNDRFKPLLGGVETHIESLVKIPNIDFEILTNAVPDIPLNEKLSSHVSINRVRPNDRANTPFENKMVSKITFPYRVMAEKARNKKKLKYLEQAEYDVLHVHGPALSMTLQRVDRRSEKVHYMKKLDFKSIERPKVLTMHGLFSPFTSNPFAEEYEKLLIGMFDHIICVDEFILNKVISYGRNDAVLIPNSIDTEKFKYSPHKENKTLKVGFVGRIGDEISGIGLLTELTQKDLPWLDISIVGAGTPRAIESFKANIKNNNVRFIPNLEPEKVPEYLSNIDILINPVMTGAITRVTLESMACGRPVIMIGKDKKGPIIHNETGYLIDQNIETLVELLKGLNDNKEAIINTGKKAREIIENEYSIDVILPKISKIYEDLI
ncbi:MAG: glycosyltransferase family 4 protein [Thermoplasmata archaeon]|nr:glycosyltransferase family 4 protein [Thermoplasmata archaeon]